MCSKNLYTLATLSNFYFILMYLVQYCLSRYCRAHLEHFPNSHNGVCVARPLINGLKILDFCYDFHELFELLEFSRDLIHLEVNILGVSDTGE